MRPSSILTIGLLAVVLLVACVPAESSPPAQMEATVQPTPQEAKLPAPTPTEGQPKPQPTQTMVPLTEAPTEIPQMVATSRGPDLEATDPSAVSLATGGLQLVEFFRFT